MNANAKKPMAFKHSEIEPELIKEDILKLQMALQRHTCRKGKCKTVFNGVEQACKLEYPKELTPCTICHIYRNILRGVAEGLRVKNNF